MSHPYEWTAMCRYKVTLMLVGMLNDFSVTAVVT